MESSGQLRETRDERPASECAGIGGRIGRYAIARRIDSGSMGTVYVARDPALITLDLSGPTAAIHHFRAGMAIAEETGDTLIATQVASGLAKTELALGNVVESEQVLQRALVRAEVDLGADNPSTARVRAELAIWLYERGRVAEAERYIAQARASCAASRSTSRFCTETIVQDGNGTE
jgi:organic hydroperoxide reductase OsmC/OhrA